ncbi:MULTISPECIES: CYTH domain-containing protein [unclassified Flavobacterium]|uniref:CYTH domain-containing protein n=1 Tax=unclassified Flavobacterium TaxID=196869 RepID=UPI001F146F67|nr:MULTISPECIES: CYTH domain-containing protein [unclassified Flavobacterium]UMY66543.1 CYTH domain-containing protein [Flavobacterium sp. HJ-32-4]
MLEIERKFLVASDAFKTQARTHQHIAQGYLCSHPERTVRVRIKGEVGFVTIKGKSSENGTTRLEWETELPLFEAKPLLGLCEPGIIDKTRYEVEWAGHVFEVDEFHGENEGLLLAEIELTSEDEDFERPDWLGLEVTADPRYYNAYLSKHPYTTWKDA